jgi:hypothetical protein
MKIIEQRNEILVAACDKEVVDLELFSNDVKIKVSQKFYGNELVTEQELLNEIQRCTSANVIGVKIIKLLVENRLIHKDAVLWFENPSDNKKKVGHAILIK